MFLTPCSKVSKQGTSETSCRTKSIPRTGGDMSDGNWTVAITGESRYRCRICKKFYAYNPERQVSCCVRHGACCHHGETLVEPVENYPGGELTANDHGN